MQGGRGVKIVIFMALRCKVMENTRKTEGAWGKSFSGPPRGPEEQRTYEQRTRLPEGRHRLPYLRARDIIGPDDQADDRDNGRRVWR